jgi:cation:H+ antiporter
MFWTLLWLAAGFLLLIKGADFLVKGASSLARRFNIPEIIIGLTIVAFGTSTPELVVNIVASVEGRGEVVLGNVIGSNNFNTFFILGIAALIFPLAIHRSIILKEIPFTLIAACAVFLLANDMLLFNGENNVLGRIDGLILLGFFIIILIYIFRNRQNKGLDDSTSAGYYSIQKTLLLLAAGFAGLIIGGKLAVDNAVILAQKIGLSERIISLTVLAAGTSLPELAASAVAAYRKKSDIAIGNIVGSSLFNIFFILAVSLLIAPVRYPVTFNTDLALFLAGTVLLILFTYTGRKAKIDRWEAMVLMGIFIGYTVFLLR